jgi:translation initiation factor 1
MIKEENTRLVYSTENGKMCPSCGRPVKECTCRKTAKRMPGPSVPNDGVVRIRRETKGRKGKGVTLISGVPLDDPGIRNLGKELKKKCGTGGTVRDGTIEIQGDHRDVLMAELRKQGWVVKRSGG